MRGIAATVISVLVVCGLAVSVLRDLPRSRDMLRSQYAVHRSESAADRARAFGRQIPIAMEVLDYWRHWLRRDDRYYVQMPHQAFSSFGDKRFMVREVSHLYLLPATETTTLDDATVVLTWDDDPNRLGLRYSNQQRAGLQNIWYSRVDAFRGN